VTPALAVTPALVEAAAGAAVFFADVVQPFKSAAAATTRQKTGADRRYHIDEVTLLPVVQPPRSAYAAIPRTMTNSPPIRIRKYRTVNTYGVVTAPRTVR
jgi:hypothetical protein